MTNSGLRIHSDRRLSVAIGVSVFHLWIGIPSARCEDPATAVIHNTPGKLHTQAVSSDWPTLLGPTHNGHSPETRLRKQWGKQGPPLVWEIRKGTGYSAPTVSGNRLVLFHRIGNNEVVQCLDTETGKKFWQFEYPSGYIDRYDFNNGPRSTPVIADGMVYSYGAEGWLHCLDLHTGKVIWKQQVSKAFNAPKNYFGVGTTPLVNGDHLIINVGATNGPCVVAFERMTGKTAWTLPTEGNASKWRASYATPVPMTIDGKRKLLVFAGGDSDPPTGGLLVIDPSVPSVDFEFPFRSRKYSSVNAASPVVVNDSVFLTSSYGTGCTLVTPKQSFSNPVRWKKKTLRAHFATPILKNGHLYGIDGMGKGDCSLVCVEAKTGRQLWKEAPLWDEVVGTRGTVTFSVGRGSLLLVDGGGICLSEYGHLLWLDLSPKECKVRSRATLFLANETWTPPVLSRGLLYVCQNASGLADGSQSRLLCYDLRSN